MIMNLEREGIRTMSRSDDACLRIMAGILYLIIHVQWLCVWIVVAGSAAAVAKGIADLIF